MQGVVEENHEDGDAPQTIELRYAFHSQLSDYKSPFHYRTRSLTKMEPSAVMASHRGCWNPVTKTDTLKPDGIRGPTSDCRATTSGRVSTRSVRADQCQHGKGRCRVGHEHPAPGLSFLATMFAINIDRIRAPRRPRLVIDVNVLLVGPEPL
jgi:hypothetical protein